jgi:uncharacterized short protein YbdD (DUF466 family)
MSTLLRFWALVRELAGDDAYERYLAHHHRAHPEQRPLDRKAFYLERQRQKWSGVQRCC